MCSILSMHFNPLSPIEIEHKLWFIKPKTIFGLNCKKFKRVYPKRKKIWSHRDLNDKNHWNPKSIFYSPQPPSPQSQSLFIQVRRRFNHCCHAEKPPNDGTCELHAAGSVAYSCSTCSARRTRWFIVAVKISGLRFLWSDIHDWFTNFLGQFWLTKIL